MKRVFLVLLLLIALPARAQERHAIDKIEFRYTKIPSRILLAQTMLTEGRTYTDEELELAVSRLRRLPFVFSAHATLDGTTLVVDVSDEHRFFYDLNGSGERFDNDDEGQLDTGIGGRWYFNPGGVLEASIGSVGYTQGGGADSRTNVQYTQYDLFGTRAFLTVGVARDDFPHYHSDFSPHVTVSVPLSLRNTVSLTALRESYDTTIEVLGEDFFPFRITTDRDSLEAHWTYDTENDPLFTVRGQKLDVAPYYARINSHFNVFGGPSVRINDNEGSQRGARATAEQYWTLSPRSTLFAGVQAAYDRTNFSFAGPDFDTGNTTTGKQAAIAAGWGHNFFDFGDPTRTNHQRVEAGATYFVDRFSSDHGSFNDHTVELNASYIFRHRWGTIRATALYEFH